MKLVNVSLNLVMNKTNWVLFMTVLVGSSSHSLPVWPDSGKSSPNTWQLFGLFWKTSLLCKTALVSFWTTFGKKFLLQHLVTLLTADAHTITPAFKVQILPRHLAATVTELIELSVVTFPFIFFAFDCSWKLSCHRHPQTAKQPKRCHQPKIIIKNISGRKIWPSAKPHWRKFQSPLVQINILETVPLLKASYY